MVETYKVNRTSYNRSVCKLQQYYQSKQLRSQKPVKGYEFQRRIPNSVNYQHCTIQFCSTTVITKTFQLVNISKLISNNEYQEVVTTIIHIKIKKREREKRRSMFDSRLSKFLFGYHIQWIMQKDIYIFSCILQSKPFVSHNSYRIKRDR